jgi:hypothetical protein
MRAWVALMLVSSVAFAESPTVRGGDAPPQDLRLSICSLTRETVQRGRVVEVPIEGRGTQIVWAGLVGAAEPHLVFAWYPRGHVEKARCVDAGLIDPWSVDLSSLPSIPVVRAVQTLKGECYSLTRTVVLAWTSGARDFELVSSRTAAGESAAVHQSEDSRFLRASELLSDGEVHDAERLALGLVGERPWDPDARALLSETWRKLNSHTRK